MGAGAGLNLNTRAGNFLKHMHEASGCDMIVCWRHNWPECPMDVVELKPVVR